MEPLITLAVVSGVTLTANAFWLHRDRSLELALRAGLCAMFLLTGTVHFISMRAVLIDMVPSPLPFPGLLVTVSGVLELGGALGMSARRLVPWSALGLSALLLAMYPANVVWALSESDLPWWDELFFRTVTQLVFLIATLTLVRLSLLRPTRRGGPVGGPDPGRGPGPGPGPGAKPQRSPS
ncbi:DoxX family protein [Streptomyces sp. NPDC004778]